MPRALLPAIAASLSACGLLPSTPDHGACPDYIACAEATGTPSSTIEVTWGEDGLCWEESDEALCRAQCEDAVAVLAAAYPDEPTCDGGGAGGDDTGDPPTSYAEGGWPIDACSGSISGTGYKIGDVIPATALLDRYGQTIDLHDFCDHTVLLVMTAAWDANTIDYTHELQGFYEDYAAQSLIVVLALGEDFDSSPLTPEELAEIADYWGVTFPLVFDEGFALFDEFSSGGLPLSVLIATGGEIVGTAGLADEDDIEAALP